jgi:hypothetical protein
MPHQPLSKLGIILSRLWYLTSPAASGIVEQTGGFIMDEEQKTATILNGVSRIADALEKIVCILSQVTVPCEQTITNGNVTTKTKSRVLQVSK